MIQLALADDDPIVRKHLSRALDTSEGIHVVAAVANGEALLRELRRSAVDIALVDVEMPVLDGISTTRKIKREFPEVTVLILTAFEKENRLEQALAAGASGFLTKDIDLDELPEIIRKAQQGEAVMGARPTSILFKAYRDQAIRREEDIDLVEAVESLDPTKREIFSLLIVGMSNQQIASELGFKESTVRTYSSQIFAATGCESRTKLAVRAIAAGLK